MSVPANQLVVRDLIEETRRHCMGTVHFEFATLALPMTAGDTQLSLDPPVPALSHGAYLGIDDEIVYVSSLSNLVCTVIRGMSGSVPAPHARKALVELSPRFSTFAIRRALAEEIASWPQSVFQVRNLLIELAGGGGGGNYTAAYDLSPLADADVLHILSVTHEPWSAGARNSWPDFNFVELRRRQARDLFPSSLALVIKEPVVNSVRANVIYGSPFNLDNFEDDTLVVGDVGLEPSMCDIAPFGAAAALLAPREISRTFSESWSQERETTQVPVDMIGRVTQRLMDRRNRRLSEEDQRLSSRFPKRWA